MKAFVRHHRGDRRRGSARRCAALDCDVRVALTHYAPVPDTLVGEPLEIYPFLGSYLLGQAIDSAPTALAVHGHAHAGTERGTTPGGVRVRNVAHPVIRQAYSVFHLRRSAGLTSRFSLSARRVSRSAWTLILWILAVVLVVAGILALFRRQILWGIVLIIVGLLVGPGGVSIFS